MNDPQVKGIAMGDVSKNGAERRFAMIDEWLGNDPAARTHLWVYWFLARRCGERGWWYGSQGEIAERYDVSEKTVRRSLIELRKLGAVDWRQRRSAHGNGWAIYRIATAAPGDWVDWPDPQAAQTDRFVPASADGFVPAFPESPLSLRAKPPTSDPPKASRRAIDRALITSLVENARKDLSAYAREEICKTSARFTTYAYACEEALAGTEIVVANWRARDPEHLSERFDDLLDDTLTDVDSGKVRAPSGIGKRISERLWTEHSDPMRAREIHDDVQRALESVFLWNQRGEESGA